MTEPTAVFVYGTLKRGQTREKCWPYKPLTIEPATVSGALYDPGPYPGLAEGDDTVVGELWSFTAGEIAATLAVLDEIEGFQDRAEDEYRRLTVQCQTVSQTIAAWTYRYARIDELRSERRIEPDQNGTCQWPTNQPSR